jgi:ABC-2 type transport system ATP-binding protein
MTNAIETADLARRFGRLEAVNGLNLQVPAGSIFALIGPNGAGKTTTIKLLMNLLQPTAGSARVLGIDSRRLQPQHLQRIGYVSENQRLPEWMTPGELFDYCRPLYPGWDDALCRTLQGELGLTADAPLRTLSRGTRMKAALLASLAYRPDLILLDEPFTGLDPIAIGDIQEIIARLRERGIGILITDHNVRETLSITDRAYILYDGKILVSGNATEIANNPLAREVYLGERFSL